MKNRTTFNIDYTLLSILILLGLTSVLTLFLIEPSLGPQHDDSNYWVKQGIWYIAGAFVVAVVMLIDYDRFRMITWFLYGIGMLSLLMLFLGFPPGIVHEAGGAVSWFKFPGIGTIQPGEFMKVFLILAIAHIITRHNEKYADKTIKRDLGLLAKILVVSVPPMGLLAVQPDLGSLLVMAAITGCMILISGIQWRILFAILFVIVDIVLLVVAAWYFFPESVNGFMDASGFDHVTSRFTGWLNPEKSTDGYQLINGMLAIGSGQLIGKGVNELEVHVPERHTDMIFTAIAEQFGFIGSAIVVTLFFLLIYRLIHIAMQSNDSYGSYLVTGIVGMFAYQIFQNIGMSVQLLPITGLPLPFLSYGGSSTMTYIFAIGIVLNVHSRTKDFMFETRWRN